MLTLTSLYAAPIAFLFIWLSWRVITYRRENQKGLGDHGDKSLLKRMRAQANCAEYAPLGLILLALVELQGAPALIVHVLGATLLVGRLLHGIGFSASPPKMAWRISGMGLTLTMIAASALCLLVLAIL